MFGEKSTRPGATEFFRPALILLSGNALGPVLALLLTPALSRVFTPGDFGIFAVVTAAASLISVMASWRYEMAISLPKKTREAASLVSLAVIITLVMTAVSVLAIWVAGVAIANLLKHGGSAALFWYIPPIVLFTSLNNILFYWAVRRQNFKQAATARGISPAATSLSQIAFAALTKLQAAGLLLGNVLGLILTTAVLGASILTRDRAKLREGLDLSTIRKVAKDHSGMARFALQTNLVNRLSVTLLPFVLVGGFGAAYGGLYLLIEMVIARPLQLVVVSIWQVNHALLPRLERAERIPRVMQVNRWACYVFAFPLAVAGCFASFFPLIFGSEWQDSSRFVPWIALMIFFNSVSNATSYFIVFDRLRAQTYFDTGLAILRLAALIVGFRYLEVFQTVALYAVTTCFIYFGILIFWGIDFGRVKSLLANLSLSCGLALSLSLAGRWILDQHLIAGIIFLASTPIIYLLFAYPKLKFTRVVTRRT